jgi:hypothetical protein
MRGVSPVAGDSKLGRVAQNEQALKDIHWSPFEKLEALDVRAFWIRDDAITGRPPDPS